MPYLPPPPEALEPELACALVFYPDSDEYRRALFGQIKELSDVWNWEADRETQATIRSVWLAAELETIECANMACLDEIITLLEAIRDHEWCCDTVSSVPGEDEIVGVDDTTMPPDVDIDGEVLPPGHTGDPTGYDAYLCGAAHRLAGASDGAVDTVYDVILAASNILVFATLVVLAFGNVIGMGIAAILAGGYTLVTVSEIVGYYSAFTELRDILGGGDPQGLVSQTKAELATIYDEIVEAIACSNDAAAATTSLHALLDANVTNASYRAMLKVVWSRPVIQAIFWDFVDVPDRFDCSCVETTLGPWDWGTEENGWDGWTQLSGGQIFDTYIGRHTLGNVAELEVSPLALRNTVTLTLYQNKSASAGSMNSVVKVYDTKTGGVYGTELDSKAVEVTALFSDPPQECVYALDISARTGATVWVVLAKAGGSTGYPLEFLDGSGQFS